MIRQAWTLDGRSPAGVEPQARARHQGSGRRLLKRVQSLVERTFGVRITRAPSRSSAYADAAIRDLRHWRPTDVVFDVGANDGRTILRIREQLASPRIFAFEPVASTFQALVERTSHLDRVVPFQLALGARRERRQIYVSDIPAMSSLSPDWTAPASVETIEVSTVDAVMSELGIEFVHFLKVDTEGCELEVLSGAEDALRRSRVAIIQLEVGFDQMASRKFATLEEARRHLAARGYVLHGIHNQCRTKGRAPAGWPAAEIEPRVLAYCDAVFIRADLVS